MIITNKQNNDKWLYIHEKVPKPFQNHYFKFEGVFELLHISTGKIWHYQA